jgi:hypothetical protein
MEFMNRGAAQPPQAHMTGNGVSTASHKRGGRWKDGPLWLRVVWIVLLFSGTIVLASLLTLIYIGNSKESDYVDNDKYQAVFLTNGQVYFGKVKDVNSKYMNLKNIYYLNVNQQVQPKQGNSKQAQNSISLVKLGCELHGPLDQMVINRDQVTFWENLKTDGQVSKAIGQWLKQHPTGENDCQASTASNSTDTNTNSNSNTQTESNQP